jgi:hypothetical protein
MSNRDLVSVFCMVLAPFVEEAIFSPVCVFGSFVKDQMAVAVWVYLWVFYSVPLVFMSVFVTVAL